MQCGVEKRIIKRQEKVVVEYFRCREKGHKCRECPFRKKEKRRQRKERAMCVTMPQKVQQIE